MGSQLFTVKSHSEIINFLKEARYASSDLWIWKMIDGKRQMHPVLIKEIDPESETMVILPHKMNMTTTSDEPISHWQNYVQWEEDVNFFWSSKGLFFQAPKTVISEHNFSVKIPKMMARIEKRKYLRLEIDGSSTAHAELRMSKKTTMGQSSMAKNCYDISAGGLSIIVRQEETKFFNVGETLRDVTIILGRNKKIPVVMKVINLLIINPHKTSRYLYGGVKVCCQFIHIRPQEKDLINQFVFENLPVEQVRLEEIGATAA